MKEVLDFLNKVGVYYLATAEGDQPHVRPIGFVMDCEADLPNLQSKGYVQATCG